MFFKFLLAPVSLLFLGINSLHAMDQEEALTTTTSMTYTTTTTTTTATTSAAPTTTMLTTSFAEPTYWASSANFTVKGKVAVNPETHLHSDKLMEWHMSQAPQLADVYSNYQFDSARNVAKGLVSIVYSTLGGDVHIAHKPLKFVFINGWQVQDTFVGKSVLSRMRLDPASKGTTELAEIMSLHEVLGLNRTSNYVEKGVAEYIEKELMNPNKGLINGFSSPYNLLSQTQKYADPRQKQQWYIRDLKEKQTHSEKLILIYIDE